MRSYRMCINVYQNIGSPSFSRLGMCPCSSGRMFGVVVRILAASGGFPSRTHVVYCVFWKFHVIRVVGVGTSNLDHRPREL